MLFTGTSCPSSRVSRSNDSCMYTWVTYLHVLRTGRPWMAHHILVFQGLVCSLRTCCCLSRTDAVLSRVGLPARGSQTVEGLHARSMGRYSDRQLLDMMDQQMGNMQQQVRPALLDTSSILWEARIPSYRSYSIHDSLNACVCDHTSYGSTTRSPRPTLMG